MTTIAKFADHLGLTLELTYKGIGNRLDPERQSFEWEVTLWRRSSGPRAAERFTTQYSCGLGHCVFASKQSTALSVARKAAVAAGWADAKVVPASIAVVAAQPPYGRVSAYDVETSAYVPTPPSVGDFLLSIQSDCQSGEDLLFEDFCSEFGYDTDSRKAEKVWRECQRIRGEMQKFFAPGEFVAFMAATECEEG